MEKITEQTPQQQQQQQQPKAGSSPGTKTSTAGHPVGSTLMRMGIPSGEQRDFRPDDCFRILLSTHLVHMHKHRANTSPKVLDALKRLSLGLDTNQDPSDFQRCLFYVIKFLRQPWHLQYAKSHCQIILIATCQCSGIGRHSWSCLGYMYPYYPDKVIVRTSDGRIQKVSVFADNIWNIVRNNTGEDEPNELIVEPRIRCQSPLVEEPEEGPTVEARRHSLPPNVVEIAECFDAQILSVEDDEVVTNMSVECGEYENRKQPGLANRERRRAYAMAAAHAEQYRKQRSKMTVKQRNNKFREELEIETNMFAFGIGEGWNALFGIASNAITASDWIEWLTAKTQEMGPHLIGVLAGWMVQPPNVMRAVCDLFVLAERLDPEGVRCSFMEFIAGAKDFIEQVCKRESSSNSADANRQEVQTNASNDTEHLETGSYLTLIGELLTGVRLKDRVKFAYRTGMSFGNEIKRVASYAKAAKEIVGPLVNFIKYYVKAAMRVVMFQEIETPLDLSQFVLDVELLLAYNDSDINRSTFPDEVNTLWLVATKVRTLLMDPDAGLKPQQVVELRNACANLSKFRTTHYIRLQQNFSPVRNTPFCIAFVGESGCGKSEVAPLFIKDMCDPSNCNVDTVSDDCSDLIYYDGATKHKEGYRGQPCWFRDDFMQHPEGASTAIDESDALFLISAVSGTQLPLEMAHLENKGMFFNSDIFCYTSNVIYPDPRTVESARALQRRRNVLIYVTFDDSDKDNPIYPEEDIPHIVDGVEMPERRLQYTDFHILPSVLEQHGQVLNDSQFSRRPKHGEGMSYTNLLRLVCGQFNAWQDSASASRMLAPTPNARRFDLLRNKQCVVKRPNRFKPEPRRVAREARVQKQDVIPEEEVETNMALSDAASKVVYEVVALLVATFGISIEYMKILHRHCPTLLVSAAVIATAISAARVYEWLSKDKTDERDRVLMPAAARDAFVNACHPLIRAGLDDVLEHTNAEFNRVVSQMAVTHGYGDKLLQSKAPRMAPKQVPVISAKTVVTNAGLEGNLAVQNKVYRNMRTMAFSDGSGELQAIGICGQWVLCNQHFFEIARQKELIQDGYIDIAMCRNGYTTWVGQINMKYVRFLGDDLAVFKLSKYCEQFPDIRKHFVSKNEVHLTNGVHARALTVRDGYRSSRTVLRLETKEFQYRITNSNEYMKVQNYYVGDLTDFVHGDCGGPFISEPVNKICAIHSASNRVGRSIAAPVHAEMFDFMVEQFKMEEPSCIEEEVVSNFGDVVPVGIVPKQMGNFIVDKSDIVPSPVHGKVAEVTKAPSVKSLKDVRITEEAKSGLDPLRKSFVQYFDPVKDVKKHIFKKAMTAVKASLSTLEPDPFIGRRVLTDDEVLNGVGSYPSIDLNTSAGMPQRTYSPLPGKHGFFVRDPVTQRLDWGDSEAAKKFKADYHYYDQCLKEGTAPFTVLMEQLKDETLKLEKVANAKTRTFEVFPGPLGLLHRKYSGAFNAALQRNCVQKPVSVGINPHSVDWKLLYERLGKFGGQVIAGDYQAWDKRLNGQAIYGAAKQENMWYDQCTDTPEPEKAQNRRIRLLLAYMMIHAYVVVQRVLYHKHQGMPSGVPVTSTRNSIANWLYISSAIFTILEEEGLLNLLLPHELNEHVELALYGDDHIIALSGTLREHVTFRRVQKHFRERNVGYTDAVKSAASDFDFQDLTDVTFLKRRFDVQKSRVYAPLDKTSVEDQLNWVKFDRHRNIYESFSLCYDSLITESHLHGREYFDMLMSKLWAALQECSDENAIVAKEKFPHSTYADIWSAYNERYAAA